jgi:hypothetical protein
VPIALAWHGEFAEQDFCADHFPIIPPHARSGDRVIGSLLYRGQQFISGGIAGPAPAG